MSGSPVRLAPAVAPPPPDACLNCDEELRGAYCLHCGQAASTKRFTVRSVLHEIPHAIFHLDHALPHTLKALATAPGPTIRTYLAGKRAHVYSPFALLFLLAGLLAAASLTLPLPVAGAKLALSVAGHRATSPAMLAQNAYRATKYLAWVTLLLVPLRAIGPYILLRRATGLRYAEQMVAATMIAAGVAALQLGFFPFLWLAKGSAVAALVISALKSVAAAAYVAWAYAGLQDARPGERRWTRALGCTIGTHAAEAAVVAFGMSVISWGVFLKHLADATG